MIEEAAFAGTLGWGIKDSFRAYLSRQADFSLNLEDGVTVGVGNRVHFRLVGADPAEGVVWAARGHAIFRAHHGMMRLSLKDPLIRQRGGDLVLAFDFGPEADGSSPEHFDVARLVELPTTDAAERRYQAFLLPEATGMFNDMYDANSELDGVTVSTAAPS